MNFKKGLLFLSIVILFVIFLFPGCVKDNDSSDLDKEEDEEKEETQDSYNISDMGLGYEENSEWPDYIPEAIPELEGEITTVFADEFTIRIFYNGVTRRNLEDYIETMKKAGFDAEYIIYVQEGFADNSKEREKKGEYDAVKFIKDNYEVTVEQGEDVATLDIASNKFSQQEKEAINQVQNSEYEWPSELSFPQPANSEIELIQTAHDGSMYIECVYESENNINEYVDVLVNMGFEKIEQSKNQNGKIIEVALTKDDITLELNGNMPSRLILNIWTDGSYEAQENGQQQVIDGTKRPGWLEVTKVL